MYYEGEGVPEDYAETMKWWRKAAAQGDADAKVGLKIVERQVEQDKEQAKEQAKEQKAADAYGRTPEGKQQHCQANCNSDKSRCESNNAYDRALLTGSEQGIASGLVLGSIKDCYNEERNCAASCK
jgi:TPR repeat protein